MNNCLHIIFTYFEEVENTEKHNPTKQGTILLCTTDKSSNMQLTGKNVNCSLCHYIVASPKGDDKAEKKKND